MKCANRVLVPILLAASLSGCLVSSPQQFFNSPHVCNALGDDDSGSGIKGSIHYLTAEERAKGYSGVSDFLTRGKSPNVDFYVGRLNVPTRPFAEGFQLATGEMVKDNAGNDLVEYFAFHFTSRIRLPIAVADRYVQFALLSDDGARLIIHRKNADGTTSRVINVNNDGDHPTRMGCGVAPVRVSAFEELEVEIDYYQGPRYHIALTMLWREWLSSGSFNPNDTYCGKSGNDLFWNSNVTPSAPKAAYNDLMTRWSVVPSEVFIPDALNPCM